MTTITSHDIEVNGVSIHVKEAGSSYGPPVLLLHGWPDSSAVWREQIPFLAEAGYHVIAPDLRGFGESAKPEAIEEYNFFNVLGDLNGVLAHFSIDTFYLCGHDWGAFYAWALAAFSPERVRKLVALSVGHPTAFGGADWEQKEKSWYMLWFQFPGAAEATFANNNWQGFRDFCRDHADTNARVELLSRPGALTASLNIYRANIDPASFGNREGAAIPPATCPTIGIWSSGDPMLTESQMLESAKHVTGDWKYIRFEGGSHWIPTDHARELNTILLDFFA